MKTPGDLRKFAQLKQEQDMGDIELAVHNFLNGQGSPSYREHIYSELIFKTLNKSQIYTCLIEIITEYMHRGVPPYGR